MHFQTAEHLFFSDVGRIFTYIDHVPNQQECLNTEQRTEFT